MLGQFIAASVLLTVLPGPDILFVLTQSLTRGWRPAWVVAWGLCSGLVFHTAAVALGVGVLVVRSPGWFAGLKYAGAAYLLWLGFRAIREAWRRRGQTAADEAERRPAAERNYRELYGQGLTMNLLNPKVLLFFLSFLPGFVDPEADSPTLYLTMLGAIFAGQAWVVFTGVALLGGWIGARCRTERRINGMGLAIFSALLYAVIAVWIVR